MSIRLRQLEIERWWVRSPNVGFLRVFKQLALSLRLLQTLGVFLLVSMAMATSDSFAGLRALLIPNKKKPSAHKRRGRRAMFGVEDGGRSSLLEAYEALGQLQTNSRHWHVLYEDQLDRLIGICLLRWAVDSLNLLNLIFPNRKLSRLNKNRMLYENGIPIAVLESGKVIFLKEIEVAQEWNLQQALIKKNFPARLRSYLGTH